MHDTQRPMYQEQLSMFISEITGYVELHASKILPTTFPIMEPEIIKELTQTATNIFKDEPSLLETNSDIVIVGDLHGQVFDLIRVLDTCGMPDKQKYLFLGDIVDRGEFSIETIIIVLLLKVIWPDQVLIIRGNHEFRSLCSNLGFGA
ncbi:serine/threonine protein phosphatase, putative [Trichomonas vaginalis G3]|uniref:Serine/threonine-protein phosphatase n=1 Tax=Trichomonas vaginalis (strain ATCC PRA-98 / G3) TaxID=412133 RepID=A2FR96_TRIV3|nr:serine/threonine protein phosphatase, putative [Trichomonas vaginalis G3]|eukprot:XP_001305502.1 serine/threonine protein phosphatase [Trichomonas vaginalis G3]